MAAKFIEPVLDKFKTLLTTNLDAQVALVNADYVDFDIANVNTSDVYVGKVHVVAPDGTVTLVIWPEDAPGEDSGAGAASDEVMRTRYRVVVYVSVYGQEGTDDPQDKWRAVYRYQRAVIQTIKATHNLGGTVDMCHYAGLVFGSPWILEENSYVNHGGVVFEIEHEETV